LLTAHLTLFTAMQRLLRFHFRQFSEYLQFLTGKMQLIAFTEDPCSTGTQSSEVADIGLSEFMRDAQSTSIVLPEAGCLLLLRIGNYRRAISSRASKPLQKQWVVEEKALSYWGRTRGYKKEWVHLYGELLSFSSNR